MSMNVGGISPGNIRNEQQVTNTEKQQRVDQEAALEARRMAERVARAQAEKEKEQEQERAPVPPSNFVMSETDMKELLILMGSRGNSQTVEKMVEGVKRLKEQNERRA